MSITIYKLSYNSDVLLLEKFHTYISTQFLFVNAGFCFFDVIGGCFRRKPPCTPIVATDPFGMFKLFSLN